MNLCKGCFFVLLVLYLVCLVLVAGCSAPASPSVSPTVAVPVSTVAPTVAPTATVEPSATPEPTVTNTPEPTLIPTQAFTATRGSRVWTIRDISMYLVEVGNWFLSPGAVPLLPREGDVVVEVLEKFVFNEATTYYEGPVELVDPDAVCAWTYQKLEEGYGLGSVTPTHSEHRTRAERWDQFSFTLGDPTKEPYCPQFDKNLDNPFAE